MSGDIEFPLLLRAGCLKVVLVAVRILGKHFIGRYITLDIRAAYITHSKKCHDVPMLQLESYILLVLKHLTVLLVLKQGLRLHDHRCAVPRTVADRTIRLPANDVCE